MIVSFSISNFRSFLAEETFSLVASKRLAGNHDSHTAAIPHSKDKVLRTGVVYGANGAGKSNLFRALRYVQLIALQPAKDRNQTGREAFLFSGDSSDPSSFDLQFIANDKLYRFGFKADEKRITEEWLIRVEGEREKIIFERVTHEDGTVEINGAGLKHAGKKVEALATIGGPQGQSFLATVRATLDVSDLGEELTDVLAWFEKSLILIGPSESLQSLGPLFKTHPDLLEFAGSFLKSTSTGIDHLEILTTEISEDELRGLLPENFVSRILERVQNDEEGTAVVGLSEGNELLIERKGGTRKFLVKTQSAHQHQNGQMVSLDLKQESDGTRRLLQLLPALHHLNKSSAVYFIDEIDRSLHPMLVRAFLEFFLQSCDSGQIIVTTHESNLLDQDLLRRDEIWFAEKDQSSATRLYSLMDFKVRNDLEIRKHYLQGRFGAVPFFGDLDNLLEKS